MTIQRQYTLPNCNLILEGLSTDGGSSDGPLTVLLNMECHLPGAAAGPLTGGREFLNHLVTAVSNYAQRLLSGVPHPTAAAEGLPLVELKPGEGPYHRLVIRSDKPLAASDGHDTSVTAPLDIKLSTVQFYDLMEAVDQLLADTQTLPDLTLDLNPVPRRFVKPAEPIAKRAAPAVIGASALAATALALFFVPPPQIEPKQSSEPAVAEPTVSGTAGTTNTSDATDTAPTSTPAAETNTAARGIDAATAAATVDRLEQAAVIRDGETLASLQAMVSESLKSAWKPTSPPEEDWAYRITVSEGGDILGYKYQNDAALANVDATPLPQKTYTDLDPTQPETGPVAQFIAHFTPAGEVVLEPFESLAKAPVEDRGTVAAGTGTELSPIENPIETDDQIESLNRGLRSQIIAGRKSQAFSQEVTYRVRLDEAGNVVGFEPDNQAAQAAVAKTPLPDLLTSGSEGSAEADFKVVFTQDGVVEVSPWNGWPK